MRIFLTGASGFIGSNLVATLLENKCEILALAYPDDPLKRLSGMTRHLGVVRGELSDVDVISGAIDRFEPEACIHLAWFAEPNEYLHSLQNVNCLKQSLDLLDILGSTGCKNVVMVGTCAEYDTRISPLKEDTPVRPETIYAASKLALMLVGQHVAKQKGLNFAWARIFYLFGPNEDERRLIPSLIKSLANDEPFMATEGQQVRDYLYVKDVASALWFMTNLRLEGIYNICSGIPVTLHDLLLKIAKLMDKEHLIRFGAIPYREWEPMNILGDSSKLRNEGWSAEHSLEEGLAQTVDWWLCQKDR